MIGIIERLNANILSILFFELLLYNLHLYLVRFCQSKSKEITSIVICSRSWVLTVLYNNMSNCQAESRRINYSYILIRLI
jgi:hypothetical protein